MFNFIHKWKEKRTQRALVEKKFIEYKMNADWECPFPDDESCRFVQWKPKSVDLNSPFGTDEMFEGRKIRAWIDYKYRCSITERHCWIRTQDCRKCEIRRGIK